MARWLPLVFAASSIACAPKDDSPAEGGGASESTTFATTSTSPASSDSSTAAGTAVATTTQPDLDTTDSGSSGNPGADCPPAGDIGAVTHFLRAETWTFADDFGISEGVCSAIDYDGEQLLLQCTRVGEGPELHTMAIVGGGPVVGDALDAMVGMQELQLFLPYAMSFFPDIWVLSHFSLRSASGDLLVLGSYDWSAPGDPFAEIGVDGWTEPFTELALVDHDCALVYNRPDTAPASWKPFALEVGTDDGTVSLFEGQQETVTRADSMYEVSVALARTDIPCPADCPQSEIEFSIVRRL